MKPSVHTYKSRIAFVLGLAATIFSIAALPQTAAAQPQSPSLVYSSRSSSFTTGYTKASSGGTGIMVLGPQFTEETEIWTNDGQAGAEVTKREVQEYFTSVSKTRKSYFKMETSDQNGPNAKRVVGFFNMAAKTSTKPSLFFAMMPFDYTSTSLSDIDGTIIGKATQQSPYAGAPKILMATSMQSSYRSYNLNADIEWHGEGVQPEQKNLGQNGTTRIASLISGKTTYSHNSALSELVKNKNFTEACAAIEKWLEDNGYQNDAMQ